MHYGTRGNRHKLQQSKLQLNIKISSFNEGHQLLDQCAQRGWGLSILDVECLSVYGHEHLDLAGSIGARGPPVAPSNYCSSVIPWFPN